ncbi:Hypothetical protein AT6N2_L0083 [Agrobacterium tumefaciens]|nr:Hypothetical protein AT6N2_L0083 [Agrobacterium tumefaciens]
MRDQLVMMMRRLANRSRGTRLSVAKNGTGYPRLPDVMTESVGFGSIFTADTGRITRARAKISASLAHDQCAFCIERLGQLNNCARKQAVRHAGIIVRGKLHTPGRPVCRGNKDGIIHGAGVGEPHAGIEKRAAVVQCRSGLFRRIILPGLHRMTGNGKDVVPCLRRQATVGNKIAKACLARIVGRCGETEIAEPRIEFGQITGRRLQCGDNVETVVQTAQPRRSRHELCNAFRPLGADGIRPKQAFPPDQTREIIRRNRVPGSQRFDGTAKIFVVGRCMDAQFRCDIVPIGADGFGISATLIPRRRVPRGQQADDKSQAAYRWS